MTWNTLKVSTEKNAATIVMDRQGTRNALSQEMVNELNACLAELELQKNLRVLVLTGAGKGFCSGADLNERFEMTPQLTTRHRETVLECVQRLENFPVPVIAKINGAAIAGGFEVALACDIRIAAESAIFALTEVMNVGSFPGGGGPVRLPRLVGKGNAKLICFTGRRFTANEGLRMGFVQVVCADDQLDQEAASIVQQIAGNSPLGIRAMKKVLNEGAEMHVSAAIVLSQALRNPLDHTKDYREGLTAWLEKRRPEFIGE
jgi:enoyl-CoA hydratase